MNEVYKKNIIWIIENLLYLLLKKEGKISPAFNKPDGLMKLMGFIWF